MNAAPSALRRRILPATAAAAVIAALSAGAWYGYDYVTSQPIKRVIFAGDVKKLSRADLDAFEQSVQGVASSGASLLAVREAARRIPWVRDATVRRRFPDAVEITFETHEPLARWGDGALVSTRGEIFTAPYDGFLPRFRGPDGAGIQMTREYPGIVSVLAPLKTAVTELRLSARGGWHVELDSGLSLELGRGELQPRLQRFVAAWPALVAQGVDTKRVDLRYPNGFAVTRNK